MMNRLPSPLLHQRSTNNTKALELDPFHDIAKAFASTAPPRQPSNTTLQLPTPTVTQSPPLVSSHSMPFSLVSVLVTGPCHLSLLKTSRTRRAPSIHVHRQHNVVRRTLHHRHPRLPGSRRSLSMVEVTLSAPQALIPLTTLRTSVVPRPHSATLVSCSASVYEHAMDGLIYIIPFPFSQRGHTD